MHPLPQIIKVQVAKDIGYGLVLGLIPGLYFKEVYVNRIHREREAFYSQQNN